MDVGLRLLAAEQSLDFFDLRIRVVRAAKNAVFDAAVRRGRERLKRLLQVRLCDGDLPFRRFAAKKVEPVRGLCRDIWNVVEVVAARNVQLRAERDERLGADLLGKAKERRNTLADLLSAKAEDGVVKVRLHLRVHADGDVGEAILAQKHPVFGRVACHGSAEGAGRALAVRARAENGVGVNRGVRLGKGDDLAIRRDVIGKIRRAAVRQTRAEAAVDTLGLSHVFDGGISQPRTKIVDGIAGVDSRRDSAGSPRVQELARKPDVGLLRTEGYVRAADGNQALRIKALAHADLDPHRHGLAPAERAVQHFLLVIREFHGPSPLLTSCRRPGYRPRCRSRSRSPGRSSCRGGPRRSFP